MAQLSVQLRKQNPARWLFAGGLVLLASWIALGVVQGGWLRVFEQISNFSTVVLGIFIEGAPFLLLGSLGSAVMEVFFKPEEICQALPKRSLPGAFVGALLGLFFPVCECGVVPLSRRLLQKGAPPSVGIAFLLGAPALNPVVLASTFVAFGWGPIFWGRIVFTLLIATITGAVLGLQKDPKALLNHTSLVSVDISLLDETHKTEEALSLSQKISRAASITVEEFFEIGRFFVLGASLAAVMQTFIPQTVLFSLSRGPVLSVLTLIALAVLLSVCSTVDAFIALSFAGSFTTGAVLAFLVFGPMVDIKSTFLFLHVFQRKNVLFLILFPLLLTILIGIFLNLNVNI
ncbi:MAG TPA: permease [Anaerolineaceae bacterium]|nr:permease [Anaerolineaceae bacterium]